MVTVGVDLHKRFSQVAILTPEGEVSQHRVDNDPEEMAQFFSRILAPAPVAIEASATWWWLVDLLERLGHHPVLSHPKQTKVIAAARLKNDRVDAERLALLLRGDLLPRVWIPSVQLREARELVRHRVNLSWFRARIKTSLQSLMARRNFRPRSAKRWMSARGQRELAALSLDPIPHIIRENCFALLRLLDQQVRDLDKELTQRWKDDPRVRRLTTIPGIGPFIAITLVLELGDIHRFPTAKHVASYTGLTPVCGQAETARAWDIFHVKEIAYSAGRSRLPQHRPLAGRDRCVRGIARCSNGKANASPGQLWPGG